MGWLRTRQGLGLATLLLSASAFLSRLMGLVRDKIISWQFGAGSEADMYFAAFVVPDMINYLLAGSFMSITIMPLLAKGFATDEEDAWRFFSAIFLWMTGAAVFFTLLCEIWAPQLARLTAPGFDQEQLVRLALFMRIILPAQIFFLSGAAFNALLLLRRQFTVPALMPLIYNGSIILFGLLLPWLVNVDGMTGYCVGVTVGAFLGAFSLPLGACLGESLKYKPTLWHPWLKKFFLLALPLMLGQTVVMLDEQFLRVFGSLIGEGAVSLLNYARRIAQVPVALMGQAVAAASYPFLVSLLAKNDHDAFADTLRKALANGLGLIFPLAAWMIAASQPILEFIFQGGNFEATETAQCAPLAAIMLCAAPVWLAYLVLSRAYYAWQDTLTPAITGTVITLVCIPAYLYLGLPLGMAGIALISGAGLLAYLAWLLGIWLHRHGSDALYGLGSLTLALLLASLVPTLCAWSCVHFLDTCDLTFILKVSLKLCVSGLVFAVLYLLVARLVFARRLWPIYKNFIKRRSIAKNHNLLKN